MAFNLAFKVLISLQRDATQTSLFIILQVHSACFGCQPHPASGVHKTVTIASGTGHIFCAATSLQHGQAILATLEGDLFCTTLLYTESYHSCTTTDSSVLSHLSQCHSIKRVFCEQHSTFRFAAGKTPRSLVYNCSQATNPTDNRPVTVVGKSK